MDPRLRGENEVMFQEIPGHARNDEKGLIRCQVFRILSPGVAVDILGNYSLSSLSSPDLRATTVIGVPGRGNFLRI